jgi:hypothetical protein
VLSPRILHFTEDHTYFACGENVRCENFTILERYNIKSVCDPPVANTVNYSPRTNEYFILDSKFPDRLTKSGYRRTIQFICYIFEHYAKAGLTEKSDKEVAISGLLQRIKRSIGSKYVYGTFNCFLCRLLLWRVLDAADEGVAGPGNVKSIIPSWSWMSHDNIKFIPEGDIAVPRTAVSFGSDQKLQGWVFKLRDCEAREDEERHVQLYDNGQRAGEIWFDEHVQEVQDCVVLGRTERWYWDDEKAAKNMYWWHILLVSAKSGNQYSRLGVGKIKQQYVLNAFTEGILV